MILEVCKIKTLIDNDFLSFKKNRWHCEVHTDFYTFFWIHPIKINLTKHILRVLDRPVLGKSRRVGSMQLHPNEFVWPLLRHAAAPLFLAQ